MPGITALGNLFLEKNFGRGKRRLYLLCPWLIGRVCSAANRKGNNPAETEAVERTFHRDR